MYHGKRFHFQRTLASGTHPLNATVRSAFSHTVTPRCTNPTGVCLHTSPTALVMKSTLSIRFVSRHMVSVLAPEPVGPNESNALKTSSNVFGMLPLGQATMPVSSACSILQIGCGSPKVTWAILCLFSGLSRLLSPLTFGAQHIHWRKPFHRNT